MEEELSGLIAGLDEEGTLRAVRKSLEEGADPLEVLAGLQKGMEVVGERFEAKEYFLPDLIMSGEIFKEAAELIEPHLQGREAASKGTVVIGTVKGDVHDIGKNIVITMLRCHGYQVHDLGVDQPPEAFVGKVRETGAPLVGLSGLLTIAFDSMKETVQAFADAGMRDRVKIVIGGGPVNQAVVDYTGADDWGRDPGEALRLAERFAGQQA
jgi:methanogenic corrinoid protein MtbC1